MKGTKIVNLSLKNTFFKNYTKNIQNTFLKNKNQSLTDEAVIPATTLVIPSSACRKSTSVFWGMFSFRFCSALTYKYSQKGRFLFC